MSSRRKQKVSAAAVLSITGLAALLTYLFFWQLLEAAFGIASVRVAWTVIKARLGIHRTARRGKSLWEVVAALGGGYLLGTRRNPLGTHPCGKCGAPIDGRSRANYCSPACRRYAALEREEANRRTQNIEFYGEVPF